MELKNATDLISLSQDIASVKGKVDYLIGDDRRYYNAIPDICWMTEETIAKKLRVSRRRVQIIKRNLVARGIINLETSAYKSKRIKHLQTKMLPILTIRREVLEETFQPDDFLDWSEMSYYNNIKWDLIQSFTAEELNGMKKPDLVKLYQEAQFIVLPTAYPIFTKAGVECSCFRGKYCASPGKHPVHAYKYLDSESYKGVQDKYLNEFIRNPNLNIGMKVSSFSVLDVDGEEGLESLNQMREEILWNDESDTLDNVLSATTARGLHLFVENKELPNNAGVVAKGLDIRSQGGFLVMAGSEHKSGAKYQWNQIGDIGTIPEEWLVEKPKTIRSGKANETTSTSLKDIKLPNTLTSDYVIPNGQRELTLFKWGARLRGQGADKVRIIEELISIRDTFCENVTGEDIPDAQLVSIADYCVKNYLPN